MTKLKSFKDRFERSENEKTSSNPTGEQLGGPINFIIDQYNAFDSKHPIIVHQYVAIYLISFTGLVLGLFFP